MDFIIVGLGNPGSEYERTRHNVGWMALDESRARNLAWREKFKALYACDSVGEHKYHFLKPQTYMNLSGESVQPCAQFFKVPVGQILVIHDELDIPYGTIQFRKGGGLAGHNGLKSIAKLMGSQDFLRLRLGIGRPEHGNVSSYVLSGFSEQERISLERFLEVAANAVEAFQSEGFEKASNKFSKRNILA